eukprot:scaffold10537_cov122-Isochrysis_galbana.AAC.18
MERHAPDVIVLPESRECGELCGVLVQQLLLALIGASTLLKKLKRPGCEKEKTRMRIPGIGFVLGPGANKY